ncbi:hypothetical protein PQR52_13140 [Paraburkholderia aspalathi]|uniref:hypothetical protein n=1 Tax=Paraburkholderia aspalathi TaxID=1324617 RepID=UPI0038BB9B20
MIRSLADSQALGQENPEKTIFSDQTKLIAYKSKLKKRGKKSGFSKTKPGTQIKSFVRHPRRRYSAQQ